MPTTTRHRGVKFTPPDDTLILAVCRWMGRGDPPMTSEEARCILMATAELWDTDPAELRAARDANLALLPTRKGVKPDGA